MKFLHISDLHFHRYHKDNKATMRALEFIARTYPNHHLVITGDITDDGYVEQYRRAYDVLKNFKPKLFISPGNHDFGFAGNVYEYRRARRFDRFLSVPLEQKGTFAGFNKPIVDEIEEGGTKVVLISLDSNRETWWIGDFACGRIGFWQRLYLKRILDSHTDAVRMVCFHHHPFDRRFYAKMTDADKVMKILKGRAQVVMFGHRHRQARWRDKEGIAHVLAAGAIFEEKAAWEITIEGQDISVKQVPIV